MNLRRSVLSSGAAFVALAMSCPAFAQERSFDIPAQPAVRAIPELARQAQVQIVAPARDLEGIRTPAVKGRMDVWTALRRLIAGTPLRIDTDDGQVITLRSAGKGAALRKKAGERVEVGVIVGRVIDPATGEYKRDAIIRLITAAGERQTVASNEGGEFRILDVPAGSAKVTVSFTGYADQASAVQVIAGKTVTLDFALLAPGEEARGPEMS